MAFVVFYLGHFPAGGETVGSRFPRPAAQIPVHPFGDRFRRGATADDVLASAAGVGPGVDFTHVPNRPIPDHFTRLPDEVARVSLVSQLGCHAGLLRHPEPLPVFASVCLAPVTIFNQVAVSEFPAGAPLIARVTLPPPCK